MAPISVLPIVGSGLFELCVMNANKEPLYVGYYNDVAAADKYIAEHQGLDIYITSQILNPSLSQRTLNKTLPIKETNRTKDTDVIAYRYLLVDLDALQVINGQILKRPAGVGSTDEEHQNALNLANYIISEIGLKDDNYLLVDSGNGYHIYVPVEEGIQKTAIEAALNGIKTLYETDLVEIDDSVSNPARLLRAVGSINHRGSAKRKCVYLHCPEHLMPVSFDFIAGLKVETTPEPTQKDPNVNLAENIANQLGYSTRKNGMFILKACPFCQSTDKGAVVGKVSGGGYFFKCHHNRCKGNKWAELKDKVGLETTRLDKVRKTLKEMGSNALDLPEFQAEISNLKAKGDLHKLQGACQEVGVDYKALKRAARKPLAIAQDMSDGWITKYCVKTDKLTRELYYYQNGVYVDATDFLSVLIDEKFRGSNTTGFINNVLDYIKRHSIYEFRDEWLAVDNGVLNPLTLELVQPSPEIVTRIKLNVTFNPEATCPKFLNFIEECKVDNVKVLQESAGYPLLPDYPYQKAVMLLGFGGQGKSVFLKIIIMILGTDNTSAKTLQSLMENRFATSGLYGMLANISGDIPDMALAETGIFKALTGEDSIDAEKKGKDPFKFWNRAKLLFSANQLPPTKDKTGGFFRRWILISFLREMVQNPNPHLASELLLETSGIFNWMLEGARRVKTQGFSYTQDADKMAHKYIELSEPVVMFLEATCIEDFDGEETQKDLFTAFNKWAWENHKKRMSGKEFTNAMKNQSTYSLDYHRLYITDSIRPQGYSGVRLKEEYKPKHAETFVTTETPEDIWTKLGTKIAEKAGDN